MHEVSSIGSGQFAEHAAAKREMLSEHVHNDDASSAFAAFDRALNALWEILSGVCGRHAMAC